MASNLPPGVTDSMIPGNRPEDVVHEQRYQMIYEVLNKHLETFPEDTLVGALLELFDKMVNLEDEGKKLTECSGPAPTDIKTYRKAQNKALALLGELGYPICMGLVMDARYIVGQLIMTLDVMRKAQPPSPSQKKGNG